MSITLRILLLLASIVTAVWILWRVRKAKVKMEDAIFWICMALVLFVMGTFTKLTFWLSGLLGIQSPANCVFIIIIALLIEKIFTLSIKFSQLEDKVEVLTAEVALRTKDLEDEYIKINEKECSLKSSLNS